MSYINETDFVIENKKLVYPEIVTDGLQLYYDAKGKRDTDYHRDTMLDMSGNKNHGKLHNFAYEKHSGYKDGLVFDYIDDKLVRPTLDLKPDDFTFMLNGNIISFSPDGTVKRVQDGEVIESQGFNMIRNGDFVDERRGWNIPNLTDTIKITKGIATIRAGKQYGGLAQNLRSSNKMPLTGEKYYFCANIERESPNVRLYLNDGRGQTSVVGPNTGFVSNIRTLADRPTALMIKLQDNNASSWTDSKISDIIVINLTETFGAGKEPTKEQMDEIINRFGFVPKSQDLIDRIEYKGNDLGDMENIIDGLYKTEVLSGEEIYTDKADDAVVHVEVDGKSYQEIDPENLFNPSSSYYTNGINSGLVSWELNLKPNTIYTASTNMPDNNGTTKNAFFHIKGSTASSSLNGLSANKPFSLTTNSKGDVEVTTRLSSYAGNIGTIKNSDHWIKVEEGESATPFQGYSSPAPDYPVEIYSLNDFDVVSSVGKRNLKQDFLPRKNNSNSSIEESIEYIYKGDKSYKFGANNDALKYIRINHDRSMSHPTKLTKGVPYTASWYVYDPKGYGANWVYVDNNGGFDQLARDKEDLGNGYFYYSVTVKYYKDVDRPSHGFLFYAQMPVGEFVYISGIKVEEGEYPTPYAPALEDITEDTNHPLIDKINLLLDEPLRSVGDVNDRLFRDSDGVWKIERRIWVQVLDKNTTLISSGAVSYEGTLSTNRYITPSKPSLGYSTAMYELCTHLPHKNQVWLNDNFLFGTSVNGATQFHFRIPNSLTGVIPGDSVGTRSIKISDWLESEKNNGNPFTIQYIMREPEIETLSQYFQDKLNNLRSFEDSNYVYTVDVSTNLLDTAPLLDNHWYFSSGTLQNPVYRNGQTATQEPLPVYPGAKIRLTKVTTTDNYWRIVWVDKENNVVIREVSTVNDLILTAPNGAYGMRVSYPNNSNAVIKFDKSGISQTVSNNLKPTLHAKFLYNNWYKEDRVINNLMIYNRALTNEEMLQNYKTIKRRWGM